MKKTLPYIMPALRSVLFVLSGLILVFITKLTFEEAGRWWPILCIICNTITILILAMVCKYEGIKYLDLLNKKGQTGPKYIIVLTVIMLLVGVGSMILSGTIIYGYMPISSIQPLPVWIAAINAILLPVTIIFSELPLYFGYSLKRISKRTGNKYFSAIYIIFFYALQHSFIPLIFEWKHIIFRFVSFIPLMIVITLVYYKKRNLVPIMIGHGIMDFATGIQILISSVFPAVFEIMKQK